MRTKLTLTLSLLTLLAFLSCGEPYDEAEDVVEEFMEAVMEGEGIEAIRLLHPSFREVLSGRINMPVQFTELKPSELLACALTTMGQGIEDTEVYGEDLIGEKTALVRVRVEDKEEIEKIFTFVVMKDAGKWYIVDITSYVPPAE